MRVTIEIPSQPDLAVICRPSDPILVLQEKIFSSRGLIGGLYKLFFNDEELFPVQRLQDCGIEDGSVIQLTHWNQFVEPLDRELFTLS
jgi:hypothetical protein